MSKFIFCVTAILVCASCVAPIVRIFGSEHGVMLGGSHSPTSVMLQVSDKAPVFLHYIMLLAGVAYLASFTAIAFMNDR